MLEQARKEWVGRQIAFEEVLDELDKEFASIGVIYMPIKGAYLIKSGLAKRLRARRMDDIDILVHERDFRRTCDRLVACGKARFLHDSWPFSRQFDCTAAGHSCLLEINFQIDLRARYLLEAEDLFARSIAASEWCRLPSPADALLIVCCHALSHIKYEIREDWFADMAMISGCEDFDWDNFWKTARTTGILPFVGMMVEMCRSRHQLGMGDNMGITRYGGLLAKPFMRHLHGRMPTWLRRAVWELPFDKNPLGVALQKLG